MSKIGVVHVRCLRHRALRSPGSSFSDGRAGTTMNANFVLKATFFATAAAQSHGYEANSLHTVVSRVLRPFFRSPEVKGCSKPAVALMPDSWLCHLCVYALICGRLESLNGAPGLVDSTSRYNVKFAGTDRTRLQAFSLGGVLYKLPNCGTRHFPRRDNPETGGSSSQYQK